MENLKKENPLLEELMQFLTAYNESEQAFITPSQEPFVREGMAEIISKYEVKEKTETKVCNHEWSPSVIAEKRNQLYCWKCQSYKLNP